MTGLTVSPDDDEAERYGKAVSDLQTDVAIGSDGAITGTLKYVTGYTEFSSQVEEQSGNYLALTLKAEPHDVITVSIGERGPVDVTEDGYLVIRLSDTSDPLEVTVTHGADSATTAFDISGLTLEEEED